MKKLMRIVLTVSVLLMATGLPAYARGHVGVGVVIGPGWWGWPYPYYYPYYPPYPYYYGPPAAAEQQPNTYIYQEVPRKEEPSYWYFCKDPEGYYPHVKKCPSGWLKVVPPANPEEGEE